MYKAFFLLDWAKSNNNDVKGIYFDFCIYTFLKEISEMYHALTVTTMPEVVETEASGGEEGATTPEARHAGDGGMVRERLDYVDFLRVRGMVSDKALPFLTSSTFMRCRTIYMETVT